MQNLLRTQPENKLAKGIYINIIQEAGKFFVTYLKSVNKYTIDLGKYILDFLIEAIVGPCLANQEEYVKVNIVNQIQSFLILYYSK